MIDAAGTLTINETGDYFLQCIFPLSRTSSAGEAVLFLRPLINGTQVGIPIAARIDDDDMTLPFQLVYEGALPAGTTIAVGLARDSSRVNNGGVRTETSWLGWGTTPSANMWVVKIG